MAYHQLSPGEAAPLPRVAMLNVRPLGDAGRLRDRKWCDRELAVPFYDLAAACPAEPPLLLVRNGVPVVRAAGLAFVLRTKVFVVRRRDAKADDGGLVEAVGEAVERGDEPWVDAAACVFEREHADLAAQLRVAGTDRKRLRALGLRVAAVCDGLRSTLRQRDDWAAVQLPALEDLAESLELEFHGLQRAVAARLRELDDDDAEAHADLDRTRNRVIQVDLLLTAATFACTFCNVITGIFGMNLTSHWEENPFAFWLVVLVVCATPLAVFAGLRRWLAVRGVVLE